MGIKQFFKWIQTKHANSIRVCDKNEVIKDFNIDNLHIDMNGLFHDSAQYIYRYGKYPTDKYIVKDNYTMRKKYVKHVCDSIIDLVTKVCPKKKLVLCVDGCAPVSKQNQMRSRRIGGNEHAEKGGFDSNNLSVGTYFMSILMSHINGMINLMITNDKQWGELEVIFSTDKACGEGEHKCFSRGTRILLWNGTIKNVEDVVIGDILIGDDGTKRTVSSLVNGEDEMFEIKQTEGESYTVNKKHILSLKLSNHKKIGWQKPVWIVSWFNRNTNLYQRKRFSGNRDESKILADKFLETIDDDDVLDISVEDYMKLSDKSKKNLYGYKCSGVNWEKKDVLIDPYLLGVWLGDGTSSQPDIATVDEPIKEYIQNYCTNNGFRMSHDSIMRYRICDDSSGKKNRFNTMLKSYNLINNKHIPLEYLTNDRQTRLSLLAGLIDTDGNITHSGRMIRFSQSEKNIKVFDGIVYLAKSLGFKCCVRKFDAKCNGKIFPSMNVTISGDIHLIPTILEHKKGIPPPIPGHDNIRKILVDPLKTSIHITPIGVDKYYGFGIDGNQRFLLGDFTVTHNCTNFIKSHPTESHCFYGLDADLIMLSLITHVKNVYILRDNLYPNGEAEKNTWFLVNIDLIRSNLLTLMNWENSNDVNTINDFVFICFLIGNDFLPHIPEIEIISGGIEFMIEQYNLIGAKHGHMTKQGKITTSFNKEALIEFVTLIANNEGVVISEKVMDSRYFEDAIATKYAKLEGDEYVVDMIKYKAEYNSTKIVDDVSKVCDQYLDGLNWVLNYYISGTVDWDWYYPNHYAPFASDLLKQIPMYEFKHRRINRPVDVLLQLASIIPERNANFLPPPLRSLIKPEIAVVKDFSGVRREWEAVSLIPFLDRKELNTSYKSHKTLLNETDNRINVVVPAYIYKKSDKLTTFKTLYDGEIKSMAQRSKYEF
jgi:hypothetical protein